MEAGGGGGGGGGREGGSVPASAGGVPALVASSPSVSATPRSSASFGYDEIALSDDVFLLASRTGSRRHSGRRADDDTHSSAAHHAAKEATEEKNGDDAAPTHAAASHAWPAAASVEAAGGGAAPPAARAWKREALDAFLASLLPADASLTPTPAQPAAPTPIPASVAASGERVPRVSSPSASSAALSPISSLASSVNTSRLSQLYLPPSRATSAANSPSRARSPHDLLAIARAGPAHAFTRTSTQRMDIPSSPPRMAGAARAASPRAAHAHAHAAGPHPSASLPSAALYDAALSPTTNRRFSQNTHADQYAVGARRDTRARAATSPNGRFWSEVLREAQRMGAATAADSPRPARRTTAHSPRASVASARLRESAQQLPTAAAHARAPGATRELANGGPAGADGASRVPRPASARSAASPHSSRSPAHVHFAPPDGVDSSVRSLTPSPQPATPRTASPAHGRTAAAAAAASALGPVSGVPPALSTPALSDEEAAVEAELLQLDHSLELAQLRAEVTRLRDAASHDPLPAPAASPSSTPAPTPSSDERLAAAEAEAARLRRQLSNAECSRTMSRHIRHPAHRPPADAPTSSHARVATHDASQAAAHTRVLEQAYRRVSAELAALQAAQAGTAKQQRLCAWQTKQLAQLHTRVTEQGAALQQRGRELTAARAELAAAHAERDELQALVCEQQVAGAHAREQIAALQHAVDEQRVEAARAADDLLAARGDAVLAKLPVRASAAAAARQLADTRRETHQVLADLQSLFAESRAPDAAPALVQQANRRGLAGVARLRAACEQQQRQLASARAHERALLMLVLKLQERASDGARTA